MLSVSKCLFVNILVKLFFFLSQAPRNYSFLMMKGLER